jgi:ABC-type nitrate/sulfonate/bicarbonate transport system permease component
VLLGLWELAPRAGWVREASVPPFSDVAREAAGVLGRPEFAGELATTAWRWAAGVALALALGVPLGVLMARSRLARGIADPLLALGFPVPKAALILLFVLWFGSGEGSRVAIVVAGAVIPIVIAAHHGASGVAPALLWSARSLGSRSTARVLLPAALPEILSGLRIALAVAIFTALASELLIRGSGVGGYMFTALDNGQTVTVFAVASIVAALGFLVDVAYAAGVRRALPWLEGDV